MAVKVKEIKVENTEQAVAAIAELYGTDFATIYTKYNRQFWCCATDRNSGYQLIDTNIPQEVIRDLENSKYSFDSISVYEIF